MRQPTRLVIDSNCLQSRELEEFLSDSTDHIAVVTDYACMEIYKARLDAAVSQRISILARFPRQVIVLKGTATVCGLRGRQAGLAKRLVDAHQTSRFQNFCEAVARFANGDERYRQDINRKQQLARDHLSLVTSNMSRMASHYAKFQSWFTASEIRNIRTDRQIDLSAWETFFELITELASQLYNKHPNTKRWPSPEEWPNSFLYRSTLFQGLHFFNWVRSGSPAGVTGEKILNDMVDINFGVYATYFDGLLTKDRKSMELYQEGRFILETHILPRF